MNNGGLYDTNGLVNFVPDALIKDIYNSSKRIMWSVVEYRELQMLYTCAMKEITTKLDILDTEFKVRYKRNPIRSISSRLKKTESIMAKLVKKGYAPALDGVDRLNDIAGVRVICSYIDDVYAIADALIAQDDVSLISRKDYIKEPKPNGYRSLHLIVSIPVFLSETKKNVKVEVQIRTIAMDYWASLEHQMKYKKEIPDSQYVERELCSVAEAMAETDLRMLRLREKIELAEDTKSEDEELLERFSRIGLPL